MATTTADVVSRMVDALYESDPELDTSIGSPLRKVLDAVGEQIAQTTIDGYLTNYQWDVDSKTGGDLDDFCANFGLSRLTGQRATGVVTFSRSAAIAALQASSVATGTQVVSQTIPQQTFQTVVSANMDIGQTSVDIPVQALLPGPDGNLLANSPILLLSGIAGITGVSNAAVFVGGTIDESDDAFRTRFKSSAFRNLAGTEAMYRGIALQTLADFNAGSFGVAQVNVLGSVTHAVEQIQLVSGIANTSLASAASLLLTSVFITDNTGAVMSNLSQYVATLDTGTFSYPTIRITASPTMLDGLYNIEYDYVPVYSRNDPFNTRFSQGFINNRVDIYVNGQNSASAAQSVPYVNTVKFNNTAGSPLLRTKFVDLKGNVPANNDVFIPLAYGPILDLNLPIVGGLESFTIGGTTWKRGTNFDIVHQDDAFGYTPGSLQGIWWKVASSPAPPANNTNLPTVNYTYNSVPSKVTSNLANWRLLGTDVQVHAGKVAWLTLNFAIVYDRNVVATTVNANVKSALDAFLKRLGFNAAVQVSDLIQVAHNVQGVDNIRLTTTTDNPTTYAIQRVQSDGTLISTYNVSGRPTDVYFDERTYPLLYNVAFTPKARNTFRS
jgi:uncharacterized phage protein gp47/JayE